jgi:replication factor C subunit 3/5
MTGDAQAALRRVMEQNTKHARFCLICNYVGKITPALQSRCTRFRFMPLEKSAIASRLQSIAAAEQMVVSDSGIEALIHLSSGDMRRALNVMQSAKMRSSGTLVDAAVIYTCTGNPLPSELHDLATALLNEDFNTCASILMPMVGELGYSLVDVIRELHVLLRKLELPVAMEKSIVQHMADTEWRLSFGGDDRVQALGLIGAFVVARASVTN